MNDSYLYESELEEVLIQHSMKQYGIKEKEKLIRYLIRRSLIVSLEGTKIPKLYKSEEKSFFMRFWLNDLAIPIHNQAFQYKDVLFSTNVFFGTPLQNIYENLIHQLETERVLSGKGTYPFDEWNYAKEEIRIWMKESKRRIGKYSKHKEVYPYYLKESLLIKLNEIYQSIVQLPTQIEGFHYEEGVWKLSEEEICKRHILAFEEKQHDGEILAESELERYVIEHLHDVENGLRMIESQKVLPNGRIDILAKDQDGNMTVIELKVEKDTDVVWQQWYYTNEIKKEYHVEKVRFIVILPQFYSEIVEPLLSNHIPTDIIQFHPTIQRGKIKNAIFTHYTYTLNKIS